MPGAEGPVGPADATAVPRFAGLSTFARLPTAGEVPRWDVAVVGVPFDGGTSYRPGARFGPAAVRQGSRLLRPYHPALDTLPFELAQVVDAGDIACTPFSAEEAVTQIEAGADALLAGGGRLLAIGGDHTIALPLLRATAARHGPLALVHFDAHLDTWDTYFGQRFTHGTPFRRAWEEGLLRRDRSVHVGLRGPLYSDADLSDDSGMGFAQITTDDIGTYRGVATVVHQVLERVGTRRSTCRWTSTCSIRRTPRHGHARGGRPDQPGAPVPGARPRHGRRRRRRRGGGVPRLRPCRDHRGRRRAHPLRPGHAVGQAQRHLIRAAHL